MENHGLIKASENHEEQTASNLKQEERKLTLRREGARPSWICQRGSLWGGGNVVRGFKWLQPSKRMGEEGEDKHK